MVANRQTDGRIKGMAQVITYLKISDADASIKVWSHDEWIVVDISRFNWRDHVVPSSADRPTGDGDVVLRVANPYLYGVDAGIYCWNVRSDQLQKTTRTLSALFSGENVKVDLSFDMGLILENLNLDDLRKIAEEGYVPDRLLQRADRHVKILKQIVDTVSQLPFSDRVKIFGSAASGKEKPGDIDLFVDCEGMNAQDIRELSVNLIRLARQHYGMLDPFLLIKGVLHTRADDAGGWIKSKAQSEMIKAGRSGVSLGDIEISNRPFASLRAGIDVRLVYSM